MKFKRALVAVLVLFSFGGMAQTDSAFNYQKPLFDFDYNKPVFKLKDEQLKNKNNLFRFAALTGYREGVKPVNGGFLNYLIDQPAPGFKRLYMMNLSIADMLKHNVFVFKNYVVLEVKDPSKYRYDSSYGSKEAWMRRNAYCYEAMLPENLMSPPLADSLLADILGLSFGMQKRMVKALVLVRTSKHDKIKSAGTGDPLVGDVNGLFKNVTLAELGNRMDWAGNFPPVVNETGYEENIDMDLKNSDWKDLPEIRKNLQRYDLDLVEAMREIEVFVIREKDYKNNK